MSKEAKTQREQLTEEVAERLVREYGLTEKAIFGPGGLMKELSRAVLQRVLEGEMTSHLGYAQGERRKAPAEKEEESVTEASGSTEAAEELQQRDQNRERRRTAATGRPASGFSVRTAHWRSRCRGTVTGVLNH